MPWSLHFATRYLYLVEQGFRWEKTAQTVEASAYTFSENTFAPMGCQVWGRIRPRRSILASYLWLGEGQCLEAGKIALHSFQRTFQKTVPGKVFLIRPP